MPFESPNGADLSTSGAKRKRTPGPEEGRQSVPPPIAGSAAAGHVSPINYLMRAKADRLRLIEGDSETFGDVLETIDDYEGMSVSVLNHNHV